MPAGPCGSNADSSAAAPKAPPRIATGTTTKTTAASRPPEPVQKEPERRQVVCEGQDDERRDRRQDRARAQGRSRERGAARRAGYAVRCKECDQRCEHRPDAELGLHPERRCTQAEDADRPEQGDQGHANENADEQGAPQPRRKRAIDVAELDEDVRNAEQAERDRVGQEWGLDGGAGREDRRRNGEDERAAAHGSHPALRNRRPLGWSAASPTPT